MAPTTAGRLVADRKWTVMHRLPYKLGKPVQDDVEAEHLTFNTECRRSLPVRKMHKMFRVQPRPVTVAATPLFSFYWQWGVFCACQELNPHWHTSLLKRWLSSFVRDCGFDAVSFSGQSWLEHEADGPLVLVGALSTGHLNQNFRKLQQVGVPILAVVEDYAEGHHADEEYEYTCRNGVVKGRSTGKDRSWYDENLFTDMRDGPVGDGWFIHTIVNFGVQRVVLFDTFESSNAIKNTCPAVDVSPADEYPVDRRSCPLKLDLEIPFEVECAGLPSYAPQAFRSLKTVAWRWYVGWLGDISALVLGFMMLMMLAGMLAIPYLGVVVLIAACASASTSVACYITLWQHRGYTSEDLCPEYYLVDPDAKDFITWCRGVHRFKHRGYTLPPGFYHIDDRKVVRVPPSHPDCNYTNLIAMAEQYCASKSWNPKTGVRKLIRLFGPIPEEFFQVNSADINVKELELPPDLVRTIPIRVKINPSEAKLRIAALDYNHEDFTLPVPDTQSIAGTATTRVFQSIEDAPALGRLLEFWKNIVRGGRIMYNPTPPDFSNYAGQKRRLYESVYSKICSKKPGHYSSFLKIEALPSANITAGKAIRAIEPNSKSFNVCTFNFFHEFEKTLLATQDQHGLDLFAKGSNMDRRCEVIKQKMTHYQYVYSCDFKNFDGHHKGRAYIDEIEFYLQIGLDRFYESSLKESKLDGLYEAAQPKRHSGDLFTGSGNCLVVASMLYWAGCEHTIYCDGDDTLVFTNNPNLITSLTERAKAAGHVLTVEEPTKGVFGVQIPFCQHVFCGDQYWPSQKRICNKLFNIPFSSNVELEKKLYGKLCALQAYTSCGALNLPELGIRVDEEIAWRYENTKHMIPEPTNDPPPAGPITRLLEMIDEERRARAPIGTLIERCRRNLQPGLLSVSNGADKVVKRVVHQFVNSDKTLGVLPCTAGNCGTRLARWVSPVSRSAMFSSQFGSANFVDCTKPTSSSTPKSSSSQPTTLSPMVYQPFRTTTTNSKDHPPAQSTCSSKSERGKRGSTKQSKSTSTRASSGQLQQDVSQAGQTATSSTLTSGSPQATESSQSASTSNTPQDSTHHKPTNNSPPSMASQGSTADHKPSSTTPKSSNSKTDGASESNPAKNTNSRSHSSQQTQKAQHTRSDSGTTETSKQWRSQNSRRNSGQTGWQRSYRESTRPPGQPGQRWDDPRRRYYRQRNPRYLPRGYASQQEMF